MKAEPPARKFLLLAALMPAAVALAQNAAKPASEDVDVLGEFRVNTAKDDSFVATESTSGTRISNLLDEKQMTVAAYYPEGRTVRFTTGLRF